MQTCKKCLHYEVCRLGNLQYQTPYERYETKFIKKLDSSRCGNFKDSSKFIELKTAQLITHKPDVPKMREFHALGIGIAMGERSIFWTCSNCEIWCSLAYNFCPNCGAKFVEQAEQALKERNDERK